MPRTWERSIVKRSEPHLQTSVWRSIFPEKTAIEVVCAPMSITAVPQIISEGVSTAFAAAHGWGSYPTSSNSDRARQRFRFSAFSADP